MQRKGFIQRILLPPSLFFAIILLLMAVNKIDNFIIVRVSGLVIAVCLLLSPSILNILCFYQGANRFERVFVGFLPLVIYMIYQTIHVTLYFIMEHRFNWQYIIPQLNRWIVIWLGFALLQLSLVEIWVLRKLK